MGMMLTCTRDALPGDAAAFLICTYELSVTAVSQAGEQIFGKEERVVGVAPARPRHQPAGRRPAGPPRRLAAQRPCDPVVMPLRLRRPTKARNVGTLAARIATCGPPRAALVTVEPSEFGRR